MNIRPIIFSTPMVLALLRGWKTQTRRLASSPLRHVKAGDLLYVRESFAYVGGGDPGILIYAATWRGDAVAAGCDFCSIPDNPPRMSPGIHMPRKISRLTLEAVADAKTEHLQCISEEDAIAEGATSKPNLWGFRNGLAGWSMNWQEPFAQHCLGTARMAFANFVNELHGGARWNLKPTNLWVENPRMVTLKFRVHHCQVDDMPQVRGAP